MNFKIVSKENGVILLKNAQEEEVRIGVKKQPLQYLKLSKQSVGADVDLDVKKNEETGRLYSAEGLNLVKSTITALELQARMDKAVGTSARYARMAEEVEAND